MSISLSLSMAEEVDSDVRSVSFLCAEKIAANGPRPKAWIVSAQTTEEAAGANISGIIALLFDDLSPFLALLAHASLIRARILSIDCPLVILGARGRSNLIKHSRTISSLLTPVPLSTMQTTTYTNSAAVAQPDSRVKYAINSPTLFI